MYLFSLVGVMQYESYTPLYQVVGLGGQIMLMALTLATSISKARETKLANEIKIAAQEENERNLKYLLRVIHHDINNALHIILNATYIARKRDPDNLLLDKIDKGAVLIEELIANVRTHEKKLSEKSELDLAAVSMHRVFEQVQLLFEERAEKKGVNLHINYSEEVKVLANESMLINEILANFVSNAIKFTPRGKSISLIWKEQEDTVIIGLEDQGVEYRKEVS